MSAPASPEEPSPEEPSAMEPSAKEPSAEEPSYEEPSAEDLSVLSAEELFVEELSAGGPSAEEPSAKEPSTKELFVKELSVGKLFVRELFVEKIFVKKLSAEEPSAEEPSAETPSAEEPSASTPAPPEEPSAEEPSASAPAPPKELSAEEPSAEELSTEEPSPEEPSPEELSRPDAPEISYHMKADDIADAYWAMIYKNIPDYPGSTSRLFRNDDKLWAAIRQALAHLLPEKNKQYSPAQISTWKSLMAGSMSVTDDQLDKVLALVKIDPEIEIDRASMGEGGVFILYTWKLRVEEFDRLQEFFKKGEKTVHELRAWDDFITEQELLKDDYIHIRYVQWCGITRVSSMVQSNLYEETSDPQAGILRQFMTAIPCIFPEAEKMCKIYFIRDFTTHLHEGGAGLPWEKFHQITFDVLLEFFGTKFLLNRHKDKDPDWQKSRRSLRDNLHLDIKEFPKDPGLWPGPLETMLQRHFFDIGRYLAANREATGTGRLGPESENRKIQALLDGSKPWCYQRRRALMVYATRNMHPPGYWHASNGQDDFHPVLDTDYQMLSGPMSDRGDGGCGMPGTFYCLAPWPNHEHVGQAIVTVGRQMAEHTLRRCGWPGKGAFPTRLYISMLGKPAKRHNGDHTFLHVAMPDPSRAHYGDRRVDVLMRRLVQTSFFTLQLAVDRMMRVLENADKAIEREKLRLGLDYVDNRRKIAGKMGSLPEPDREILSERCETLAICNLAIKAFNAVWLDSEPGAALREALDKDKQPLLDECAKESSDVLYWFASDE
ncbi:hypothetical protein F4777DRAFT_578091 [Nemania sp. FL0916]|nr:hypothetical protein F4777DRAFT_578091 [Nemania sp. FL0916]